MIRFVFALLLSVAAVRAEWITDGRDLSDVDLAAVPVLGFTNGAQIAQTSNGLAIASGSVTSAIATAADLANLPPPPAPDRFTITTNAAGKLALPARFDLNDSLFAWHISQLAGSMIGMVDGWFWSPNDTNGIASATDATFTANEGYKNGSGGLSYAGRFQEDTIIAQANNVPLSGGEFTFAAWFARQNINDDAIVWGPDEPTNGQTPLAQIFWWHISIDSWGSQSVWQPNPPSYDPIPWELGEWFHVVWVFSNGTGRIYADGQLIHTASMSLALVDHKIGVGGLLAESAHYFNGDIDQAIVWQRALSAAEVSDLYNDGTGLFVQPTDAISEDAVFIYNFDEGSGTVVHDATDNAYDATAAVGTVRWTPGHVPVASEIIAAAVITSEPIHTDFVPSTVRGTVMTLKDEATVTTNEFALAVSRDGGTTWSTVPVAEEPYPSTDGMTQLFSGILSVTNQPTGTSIVFRVTTSDNFLFTVSAIGGSWN